MVKVAINGFGRIGRAVFRIAAKNPKIEIVAINDLTGIDNLVYLLKYDSVYGRFDYEVSHGKDWIKVGPRLDSQGHRTGQGKTFKIKVCSEKDPLFLPWKELGVDIVLESTGFFRDSKEASKHISAGAKKVIISAPGKGEVDRTVVLGVNDNELKKTDKIISNASCTTNCLAPVAKVLEDNFGIEKGFMTTIHAFTGGQGTVDSPNKDFRRGRTASLNFIPTSSGATKAVGLVIPSLKGKMDGLAVRGPVATGSLVDFVCTLKKAASAEEVNAAMKKASLGKMKGVLKYSEDEIVSSDVIGDSHSSVFDSKLTQVNGKMVKVLSWYDNEFGYSSRVVDLLEKLK